MSNLPANPRAYILDMLREEPKYQAMTPEQQRTEEANTELRLALFCNPSSPTFDVEFAEEMRLAWPQWYDQWVSVMEAGAAVALQRPGVTDVVVENEEFRVWFSVTSSTGGGDQAITAWQVRTNAQ